MKIDYKDYLRNRRRLSIEDFLINYDLDVSFIYCQVIRHKKWKVSRDCTLARYRPK